MADRVLSALRHDLPGESDEQLTDRARNGDKSAFGELYRRHRKAAEATAWCLLRRKSDADDVVSDAFAGVLSALRNGRGPRDNFRGYLLACVRNGCRSRRRPTVLVDEGQLERWNPALEDPERYVEADTVARAFSSLAPRWQHTLWMTEVEQLAPAEVSERLELSPNATAALTHRARQAFAEAYLAEHIVTATGADCRKIAPLLAGYVRNQLRDLQQAAVERHLVNCQHCAAAVDNLRDVNASLRSLLPLAPAAIGAATEAAVVTGTVTTTGGLSIGLPSTGVLLKGLVAVLLVAPVLSTDSPFTGGRDEQRRVDVAEAAPAAPTTAAPTTAAPTTADSDDAAVVATAPAPEPTTPATAATTLPDDDGAGGGGVRPSATTAPTVTDPPTTASSTLPATLPPVTAPAVVLPTLAVDDVVDVVDEAVEAVGPVVAAVTEPIVQTLDQALAVMGLGSTGETVTVLRSLVPLLDGPLLGSLVDELLDLTSLDDGGAVDPSGADPSDDALDAPVFPSTVPTETDPPGVPGVEVPAPTPATGASPISVSTLPLPNVTAPAISLPPTTAAPTLPPITLPPITVPTITLPPITVATIPVPAITIPSITIPDLLG